MRDEWYVARRGPDGNKRYGPVPLRQLVDLVGQGKVRGEDLVWREGMADWQRADRCEGLSPPSPPPPRDCAPPSRTCTGDYGPRYDDRPFPRRPPTRPSSSGGVIALVIGLGVVVVCLLACGGLFAYGFYCQWPVFWARPAPSTAVVKAPPLQKDKGMPLPPPGPGFVPLVGGDYGTLCSDEVASTCNPEHRASLLGQEMIYAQNNELFYTSAVAYDDVKQLGDYLSAQAVFPIDHGITVQLDNNGLTYQVRFCVRDGAAGDLNAQNYFRNLRSDIANNVFPLTGVEVQLCDANMTPLRTIGPND